MPGTRRRKVGKGPVKPTARYVSALESHRRTLGSVLAVVLFANAFFVVRHATRDAGPLIVTAAGPGAAATQPSAIGTGGSTLAKGPGGTLAPGAGRPGSSSGVDVGTGRPGQFIPGLGTIPHGLHGNQIDIVYYWKGDQTKSSPFLQGSGQEGNVDEGEAFTNLVAYVNKHADGGTLMGFPFDLHGRQLNGEVVEMGKDDDITRNTERIASELQPFAAISSHGSISAYACPRLAQAGIFNMSTYDLNWGLTERTNGMCLPAGLSWAAQVELSIAYLAKQARSTRYADATGPVPRRYGFLYAEYPGLVDSAPILIRRLKAAGVPIVAEASVDAGLTTAGHQQPLVVAKFVQAHVNTIIAPDSGSLITFTHAAQAAGFSPDYYVWPCSGEDSTGMVRLYNAAQWTRASGLTCYDHHLNADLANDDNAEATEWYRAYQEGAEGPDEPPAPTSLVYQSLLPLLVGITYAGRDLTIERFKEGLASFTPYRYDAITGRTTNPLNILLTLNAPDGSQVGDAAKVYWDPDERTPGNATPGTYKFPENRRYSRGAVF